MSNKVAIITDSIACLPREMIEQYAIRIVPVSFYVGDRIYRDWVDVTPSQAYELFLDNPKHFATSPASPGDYLEAYREVSNPVRDILCITMSSKLSTEYSIARLAKRQTETPG